MAAWAGQTGASSSWLVSVFIYDSFETGDIFQLLAASLWTLSNVLALPDALERQQEITNGSAHSGAAQAGISVVVEQ